MTDVRKVLDIWFVKPVLLRRAKASHCCANLPCAQTLQVCRKSPGPKAFLKPYEAFPSFGAYLKNLISMLSKRFHVSREACSDLVSWSKLILFQPSQLSILRTLRDPTTVSFSIISLVGQKKEILTCTALKGQAISVFGFHVRADLSEYSCTKYNKSDSLAGCIILPKYTVFSIYLARCLT